MNAVASDMTDIKAPDPVPADADATAPRFIGKVRVRLLYQHGSIGPGKINLLESIARTGSISAAARELDMTFRRGWQLLETMNQLFREPVVKTVTGGKAGGGATLTPFGEELISRFRAMEAAADAAAAPHLGWLDDFVAADGSAPAPHPAGAGPGGDDHGDGDGDGDGDDHGDEADGDD